MKDSWSVYCYKWHIGKNGRHFKYLNEACCKYVNLLADREKTMLDRIIVPPIASNQINVNDKIEKYGINYIVNEHRE